MCAINSSYYWLKANVNIEHNSHKNNGEYTSPLTNTKHPAISGIHRKNYYFVFTLFVEMSTLLNCT